MDPRAEPRDLVARIRSCSRRGGRSPDFDIFFGLEAATDDGLSGLTKDATVDQTATASRWRARHRYGVTGNFVIDPAWTNPTSSACGRSWSAPAVSGGFTILTPLPGTAYFEEMRQKLRARRWADFDMHHLLWEPAMGPSGSSSSTARPGADRCST